MPSELAWVLLLAGCAASGPDSGAEQGGACNGSEALCERSLAAVTFPGTHNSMSNADAGWLAPNQQHGLTRQLEDGVRAMMLDVHDLDGTPMLCHSDCVFGSQPLADGLTELSDFLAAHPREVLLVIVEDYVSPEAFVGVAEQAGLGARAIVPPADGAWPTLGELVAADTRVLLTAQGGGGAADWYVGAWDIFFDTPYSFDSVDAFSCELNRGDPDNALFLVNHWVGTPLSLESNAEVANAYDVLHPRAVDCAETWARPVTFLAVDHYAVGDLFTVTAELNGP